MKPGVGVRQFYGLVAIVCLFLVVFEVFRHGNKSINAIISPAKILGRNKNISSDSWFSLAEIHFQRNRTKFRAGAGFFSWENNTSDPAGNNVPRNNPAPPQNSVTNDPEEKFAARRELVRQSCQRYGKLASYNRHWEGGVFRRLRWLKKRDLVVCFSAKVGTTTWIQYLLHDESPSEYLEWQQKSDVTQHIIAKKRLVPEFSREQTQVKRQLLSSYKVLSVRHPFVRIVSAYRDKIEPCLTQSTCFGKRVIKKLHSPLSFKSFVEYLVQKVPNSIEANLTTFNLFNPHWRPYYLNCAVCDIAYDYVVKMETWDEDIRYIFPKFELKPNEHLHGNRKDSDAVALEYFKTLPRSLVTELYKRYEIDFEMFGYTIEKYVK